MEKSVKKLQEMSHNKVVEWLTRQYGSLALTRAASKAVEAEQKGNQADVHLWRSVIKDLRHNVLIAETVV